MTQFLIRVQLSDVAPDHEIYSMLPGALAVEYIYDKMHHLGSLAWHDLPRATYYTGHYSGNGVRAQYVLDIVKRVVTRCIDEFKNKGHEVTIEANIVVAEAVSLATTFPTTSPPLR